MKTKKNNTTTDPDMREEYDFSKGVRGKFAGRFPPNGRFITVDPDLTALFDHRGGGDIVERFKVFAQRRGRTAGGERLVTSFVVTEEEYRVLKPLLKRLRVEVSEPISQARHELAQARSRQQKAALLASRPRRKAG